MQLLLAGVFVAAGGAAVLQSSELDLGALLGAVLMLGGVTHATARALPHSLVERRLRLVGATGVTVAVAFPSTLTLALPLVTVLYWGAGQRERRRELAGRA